MTSVEVINAHDGKEPAIFIWLHDWVKNCDLAQSARLTPTDALTVANELINAARQATKGDNND